MRIEFLAWAATRDEFITAITTTLIPNTKTALATKAKDIKTGEELSPVVLIPCAGLQIDEIGPITKTQAIYAEGHGPMSGDPQITTPAVIIEGHHVNFCAYGDLAEMLTAGLEQYGDVVKVNGMPSRPLKPLFDRTRLTTLLPQLTDAPEADGVPAGKIGPKGLKLFDPATIANRNRIWC
jgi:hypothetical protein